MRGVYAANAPALYHASMPEECVFCRIVAGTAESSIAYGDTLTLAFMDVRAFHPGHTLVVPRRHLADIFGVDSETGAALMATVAIVARAVRDVLRPEGLSIWQSNGTAAGQEVPHLHIHVVPRFAGDGLLRVYPSRPAYPSREELDATAASIRAAVQAAPPSP
jgi:histidine triad (HIT) family protein